MKTFSFKYKEKDVSSKMKINIPKAIPHDSTLSTKENTKSANKSLSESHFGLNYLSKDDNNSWVILCQ